MTSSLAAEAAAKAGFKLSLLAGFLSPISSVLMQLANIGTILFASWQVAAGAMAFSDLVVFLMYFSYFSSSVSQFVGFILYAREAAVGDERIRDFETLVHPRSLPSSCHKEGGISPCPSFTFFTLAGNPTHIIYSSPFIMPYKACPKPMPPSLQGIIECDNT